MDKNINTLTHIFPTWSMENPENLVDLLNSDYDSLDEAAKALRQQAVDLVHSYERKPILTPSTARELLENHHLPVKSNRWVTIALNQDKERFYVKSYSALRLVHYISNNFPSPEQLAKYAPLPENGSYLIIYGGSTSILEDESSYTAFKNLIQELPVGDLLIWDETETAAYFWSLTVGVGQFGTELVPFPNNKLVEKWRKFSA